MSNATRSSPSSGALCQSGELRRGTRHEPAADGAFTRAAAFHRRTEWLQAPRVLPRGHTHEHLLDDASIQRIGRHHCLERGQRHLAGGGPHARALDGDLAAAQHDLAPRRARAARGSIGLVRITRPTDRGAILFEHRGEDFQTRAQGQFQQLGPGVDE